MAELARLTSRCDERLSTIIAMYQPMPVSNEWSATAVRSLAGRVAGATIVPDPDGVEAERFGAATSGHALLFDSEGRLQFSGGITSSRGHEGNNVGRQSIERLVMEDMPDRASTPVFGCALFESAASCCAGEVR